MRMRIMIPSLVTTALLAVPAVAPAATPFGVQRGENSPRGGYVVTGGPVDRSARLPARLTDASRQRPRGGPRERRRHSPALRLCGPEGGGGGGGGGVE